MRFRSLTFGRAIAHSGTSAPQQRSRVASNCRGKRQPRATGVLSSTVNGLRSRGQACPLTNIRSIADTLGPVHSGLSGAGVHLWGQVLDRSDLSLRREHHDTLFHSGISWAAGGDCAANRAQSQGGALDADASVDRTVLPVPEPQYPPITELDARNAKAPPRFEVRRRKARLTWWSYFSTTSASATDRRSVGQFKCRRWTGSPKPGCATTISKCPRCVPPAGWLCLPAATAIAQTSA